MTSFDGDRVRRMISTDIIYAKDLTSTGTLTAATLNTTDLTVTGTLTFGDAAVDTLILKGRVSTMTSGGAAIVLGATYTYGELWEIRSQITSWTGIGSSFNGMYFRTEAGVDSTGKGIQGAEIYAVANNFNVGNLQGLLGYAYLKGATAKTVGTAYGLHGEFNGDASMASSTITTEAAALYGRILGPVLADYTKVHGTILRFGHMDGSSVKYGNGILIENSTAESGTRTLTTGINITIGTTTGISITGSATDAIKILTGTYTTAVNIAGTTGTGIAVGATTTAGITVSGATTNAVYVSGTSTTASSRTFKGILTVNNANYGDGYGAMESELTLTGTVAGLTAATSSWVNMASVTTGANYIAAQTNGLWSDTGGVLTNGTFIFGMRADCLLQTNGGAGGATFYPFSVVNNTNVTTAIFLCNDATSDLGETASATGAETMVPLFKDNEGVRYVKVYMHS